MQAALVIGANGAIAHALLAELSGQYYRVHAISRSIPRAPISGVIYDQIESVNEAEVATWCSKRADEDVQFQTVICCVGILHGEVEGKIVFPEKRLEDLDTEQLTNYFQTNTIVPAIWLKYLPKLMKANEAAYLAFISARVGSISDNRLGGWYGYRASKAALNMLIKTAQVELQRRAKNIVLVSYHPGTVDSPLSQPFQANVPNGKLFEPEFTAQQLLKHLPALNAEQGPHYIDWQGQSIGW